VKTKYIFLIGICLILPLTNITAWETDHRTSQFRKDFSYAILPFPYSLPGVGIGGGAMNINDSYVDAYGLMIEGDIQGQA